MGSNPKTITAITFIALLTAQSPVWAERIQASEILADRDGRTPEDGVSFLESVPNWGDPARAKAANQAAQEAYEQQVREAQSSNYTSQIRAIRSQAEQANQRSRQRTERVLDDMGKPSSVYRSGSYESRTYRSGNTIKTIRMKDGKITGSSTYRSNR